MNARLWFSSLACASAVLLAATPTRAALVTAENLLVDLNAGTTGVGDPSWANNGSLGGTFAPTNPAGVKLNIFGPLDNIGVEFDGLSGGDAYAGPTAPVGITGAGTRSIEVWAYNPGIVGEETLVAWGRRGGPNGTNLSFNYGNHPVFGAVGHWGAPDLGWGPIVSPAAGQWHHLVYTYDGAVTRVYSDGELRNGRQDALNTHAGYAINVGAQNVDPIGALEANLRYSGGIASVRVHDGVLSSADILNNYNEERAVFGAPPAPDIIVAVPEMLPLGPKHRYQFNGDANDSVGGAHGTLVNPQSLATYHDGVVDLTQANNGASSNQAVFAEGAYVDLPNGIISSLGNQATFETWVNIETNRNWDRVFDFGRSDAGEDMSTGAPNSQYIFATTQNGGSGTLRVAHRSENDPPATGFGENIVDAFGRLSTGTEHHLAVVWDEVAGMQTVYLDGQVLDVGTGPIRSTLTLAGLDDINNWLGRAQWGDPLLDASYNEFRIYDYALSANQVLGNFQAGADNVNAIPEPSAILLAGFGAAGLAIGVRRRRSK